MLCIGVMCVGLAGEALAQTTTPITGTLTWTKNTEIDLAGYKLYQSEISGQYGASVKTLGKDEVTTNFTFPQLQVDKRYFFTLTAFDITGNESPKSIEVNKLIVGVPILVEPKNFKIVTANGVTTFSWDSVPNAPGYLLRVHLKGSPYDPCSGMAVCTGLITVTSMNVELPVGEYDTWISAAMSATSWGPASGGVFTIVDDIPSAPQGLFISEVSVEEIKIVARLQDCKEIVVSAIGTTETEHSITSRCIR